MPRIERRFAIAAPAETAWRILIDVERWPEWSKSIRSAERIDEGPLRLGSQARMDVAGTRPSTLTVTEITEGRSFTWESTQGGVTAVMRHAIEPRESGCELVLSVEARGIVGALAWPLVWYVSNRNLAWEGNGLKERAEAEQAGAS